jgi:hypothetical protein
MITDIQFQNRRDVMRVAPWLDMPLLRTHLKTILQTQLNGNSGFMEGFVGTYREDMQSFCDGDRARIPRCGAAVRFVREQVLRLFPTTASDSIGGVDPGNLICTHIMQVGTWRGYDRGNEVQETPGESPHRINPNIAPTETEDYEYDEYEEEEEF